MTSQTRLELPSSLEYDIFQVIDARDYNVYIEGCGDFAYNFDRKHAYLGYGYRVNVLTAARLKNSTAQ